MKEYVLGINTILHTKDGSKIGNAIVTDKKGCHWVITTDYGNEVVFTRDEIDKYFNIAWLNCTIEKNGCTCAQMQEMMSLDHKYRAGFDKNKLELKEETDRYWKIWRGGFIAGAFSVATGCIISFLISVINK